MISRQNGNIVHADAVLELRNTFKVKKSGCMGAKIEVDTVSFKKIIDAGKLSIGWNRCHVFECFDLIRCFNCSEYHHTAKYCKNEMCCSKCSGPHLLAQCTSVVDRCGNCLKAAKELGIDIDVDHAASNNVCAIFRRKVEIEKRRVDYSLPV